MTEKVPEVNKSFKRSMSNVNKGESSPEVQNVKRKSAEGNNEALSNFIFEEEKSLQEHYPAYKFIKSGEKNQGFDVLYHNMKHGQISVKSLHDYLRESSALEDIYAKHLTRLAKTAANSSPLGTFAPMFEVFRSMSEKLASCHFDICYKLQDIQRELLKYMDEQKVKHKQTKEEVTSTVNVLQQLQATTSAVQKSKEKYHQLSAEVERLKRSVSTNKELEKFESKAKKASDEYKSLIEKHATLRTDFEQKMTDCAKKFQDIEEAHLTHMRNVLESYIVSYENANFLVGQVHQEFRRQISETSVSTLLKKYIESKGTGTVKPEPLAFEEYDVNLTSSVNENTPTESALTEEQITPPPPKHGIMPLKLPFSRRKPRKSAKESKDVAKEIESNVSPSSVKNRDCFKVDAEGFTIRPDTPPKEVLSQWGHSSSDDSDFDSDDEKKQKIHVKINPQNVTETNEKSNLDALNAVSKNLTLLSSVAVPKKSNHIRNDQESFFNDLESEAEQCLVTEEVTPKSFARPFSSVNESDFELKTDSDKGYSNKTAFTNFDETIVEESTSFFDTSGQINIEKKSAFTTSTTWEPFVMQEKKKNNQMKDERPVWGSSDQKILSEDKFGVISHNKEAESFETALQTKKKQSNEDILNLFTHNPVTDPTQSSNSTPARIVANSSDLFGGISLNPPDPAPSMPHASSMNNLFDMSCYSDAENNLEKPVQNGINVEPAVNLITTRPDNLTVASTKPEFESKGTGKRTTSSASSDSWSHLSSSSQTPGDKFISSRGPSPGIMLHDDAVPVAVAFTERIDAQLKGPTGNSCLLRIIGKVHFAFSSGILQVFSSKPDLPKLAFELTEMCEDVKLNSICSYLQEDLPQKALSHHHYRFDKQSLKNHIETLEKNCPGSKFYRIPVLSYELNTTNSLDYAPLHLSAQWNCNDHATTDVTVNYRFNHAATTLEKVQIFVPVSGGVTNNQSKPPAFWNPNKNWLVWKVPSPKSGVSPAGTLKSHLTLSSGPNSVTSLAASFEGDGSTLIKWDFHLTSPGYRLSLLKKKFECGNYFYKPC